MGLRNCANILKLKVVNIRFHLKVMPKTSGIVIIMSIVNAI